MSNQAVYKRWLAQRAQRAEQLIEQQRWRGDPVWNTGDALIESLGSGDARRPALEVEIIPPRPTNGHAILHSAPAQDFNTLNLLPHQERVMPRAMEIMGEKHNSLLLIGETGSGKTIFACKLVENLRRTYPHLYPSSRPVLWFTPITAQTNDAIGKFCKMRGIKTSDLNIIAFTYDTLRATLGRLWIRWETKIVNGTPTLHPRWNLDHPLAPCAVVCDEVQEVKNHDSDQARVIRSLADDNITGTQIPVFMMSATPGSRPYHFRTIGCILAPVVGYGYDRNRRLDDRIAEHWLREVSAPASPMDWSEAAMRRVMRVLEPHIIRFTDIKYKHTVRVHQIELHFRSAEDKAIYQEAFEEWQQIREEQGKNPLVGMAAVLVAIRKFEFKAELLRAPDYARVALEFINKGKAVIIACKSRDTFAVCKSHLIALGVGEAEIAEIYGGQSVASRREEQRKFQSDRAPIMLLMYDAGGAGLDLPQVNGVNKRPRVMLVPGAWNPENAMQVMGRPHRVVSDSPTHIYIMWYSGTEEKKQLERLKRKLRSLKEVTLRSNGLVDPPAAQAEVVPARQLEAPTEETPDEISEAVVGNPNAGIAANCEIEEEEDEPS